MEERWIQIFENYEISNLGNCRKKGITINGSINNRGYRYFQVQRDGKRINKLFHHLVAEAFIGDRPNNYVIDHIDQNKLNNNVSNLRYVTQAVNCQNNKKYRSDILTTDNKERKRIFSKEHRVRTGKCRNIRRPRGTGSITQRCNKFRALIDVNKIRHSKTFDTKDEAENWLNLLSK